MSSETYFNKLFAISFAFDSFATSANDRKETLSSLVGLIQVPFRIGEDEEKNTKSYLSF